MLRAEPDSALFVSAIMNKQFYEKVLPTQGNICVVGMKDGVVRPKFTEDLDEALEYIQQFDADDFNTFFGVGTFEGYQRKANACIFMRAFFVDLDCGENKPFPTWEGALIKLHQFVEEKQLPPPVIVNSGRGVHAYWPFTEEVPTDIWKPYAEKFKQLCIDNDFPIDEAVTADAARILRAPGSRNLKGDPLPCEVIQDADANPFELFTALLGEVQEKFDLSKVAKGLDEDTQAIYDKLNGNFEYDFGIIAYKSVIEGTGCAQLKQILTTNDCPEPLWYAGISVASRCRDADTAIHDMSNHDDRYDWQNVENKRAQSISSAKWAHSCDAFERENRGGCDGCPHRSVLGKRGPIELGRVLKSVEAVVEEPAVAGEAEDEAQPIRLETNTQKYVAFPDFLYPYSRGANGGVYFTPPPRSTKKGMVQDPDELLLHFTMYPVQRLKSPHDGECLLIRVELPHDGVNEFLLPLRSVAATDKLKEALANNSVTFEPAQAPRIASYLMKWSTFLTNTKRADIMRVQQGWTSETHESFVLGTNEYMNTGEIRYCPPSPISKNVVRNIKEGGTLEGWKASMKLFNDPGYEWHAFAVLCGFASPLIEFTNINGVIFSLYGKSGYGKTGALYGALSIWGHPENLSIFDATQNALINRMVTCKNILYGLDEQSNTDGKVVSHVAYNISSGQPKLRMMSSANQEREATYVTKLIAIITTNTKLRELMSTFKGDTNAEEMRILEPTIHKPMVPGYELTDERGLLMFESLKTHHGHAGPLYIPELFKIGVPELRKRLKTEYLSVGEQYSKNAEYRFLSNLISTTRIAGKITNGMGLTEFDLDRIFSVVGEGFIRLIDGRAEDDESKAESVLGDFINKNIQNALVFRNGKHVMEPRNALSITADVDEGVIWLSTSAVKEYLRQNKLSPTWFEGELERRGILKEKSRKQMAAGWKAAFGSTNVQAYKVVMDISQIFKDDEDTTATTTTE